MRTHEDIAADKRVRLTRQDLIAFEHSLRDSIRAFLPFTSASLHFPQSCQAPGGAEGVPFGSEPAYFKDQAELALPLTLNGELLACFMARGVRLRAPKTELRYLPAMASACLEKLLWHKASITDPATGLWRKSTLDWKTFEPGSDWWTFAEDDQLAAWLDVTGGGFTGTLAVTARGWLDDYVDPVNGEIWPSIRADGSKAWNWEPGDSAKANEWKNGFHSTEHALVLYLHGTWLEGSEAEQIGRAHV